MREIYIDGNKGGDYVRIKQYAKQEKKATMFLEVGCSCVRTVSHEVPVEFLSVLISNAVLESGSVEEAVKKALSNYSKDYKEERASKVKTW